MTLQLSDGKSTASVEIAVTGYLHGRALSQLLVAVVGVNQASADVAKVASEALTLKLRHAHV